MLVIDDLKSGMILVVRMHSHQGLLVSTRFEPELFGSIVFAVQQESFYEDSLDRAVVPVFVLVKFLFDARSEVVLEFLGAENSVEFWLVPVGYELKRLDFQQSLKAEILLFAIDYFINDCKSQAFLK